MNKEEEKKDTKKQYKVGVSELGWTRLNEYLTKINIESKRKVKAAEVLEVAIEKLNDNDFSKIRERVYTAEDKIDLAWQHQNEIHPETPLTREQFLGLMLEEHIGRQQRFKMSRLERKGNA
jgi:DNA-nicking Smr family endonuclease